MRNARMTACGRMRVTRFVAQAAMLGRAVGRVGCIDLDAVLIDVIAVNAVQMSVMQVVGVPFVRNRWMFAVAVHVLVRRVSCVGRHRKVAFFLRGEPRNTYCDLTRREQASLPSLTLE